MWLWLSLGVLVAIAAYVRLAPPNVDALHVPVTATEDKTGMGYAVRVLPAAEGLFERLDTAMMAQPASKRLAGSVAEGRVTYVSRSRWWGFPDYTTIEEAEGQIRLFARLRFGRRDFGVNAARLERIIAAAQR